MKPSLLASETDDPFAQLLCRIEEKFGSSGDAGLSGYRFRAEDYIRERLDWTPWSGTPDAPGQREVLDAYTLALRQMHEKAAWEADPSAPLTCWQPGETIQNRIRVEAGHTVGKTKLSSGLVNHFFDCFPPSIIYTFAPTWRQIHDLLWKEIKSDRRGKGLPGRILDLRLEVGDDHFATGMATTDAGGRGTERVQGQHGAYLMFVLDEAEGIPDFVWNAVDSMASGGICIVLMLANPRTRASRFYKAQRLSTVQNFRISCVSHPNVVAGREIIPGAVRREYVQEMVEKHCAPLPAHDDDLHTFALPFGVIVAGVDHPPGTVFAPNAEFLFRVLGVAPANVSAQTLVTPGRYEAATKRQKPLVAEDASVARIGVDVAAFGTDAGTIYLRRGGVAWRHARLFHLDPVEYYAALKELCLALRADGVRDLTIRVDDGGGFGGGLVALLARDEDLNKVWMPPRAAKMRVWTPHPQRDLAAQRDPAAECPPQHFTRFDVIPVHFNGRPNDGGAYADLATEMMAHAAEALAGIALPNPPEELEADLTERQYDWAIRRGVAVKRIESKADLRKPDRLGRSPDDGDGFMLAVAPDFLFDDAGLEAS